MNIHKHLAKHIPLWLASLKAIGRKKGTLNSYETRASKYFEQDLPLEEHLAKMKQQYSPRYYGFIETALNQFFYWLLVNRIIEKHPNPDYKPRKIKGIPS